MLYLDNAATTFPKPRSVLAAMRDCCAKYCGNPGRAGHLLSLRAGETVYACREALAGFFGSDRPENVVFTLNATGALNLAVKGLAEAGDHILISDLEHNAVRRPVAALSRRGVHYDVFPSYACDPDRNDERILEGIRRALRPGTRMLVCTHASNICSLTMPIGKIGALCRERGILFIVDAAQSAGHLPIDMERMGIDVLCAPGHKGLLGGQGCGFLILRDGVRPATLTEGGSGVDSVPAEMPEDAPERYEAGTLPLPAIAGLLAGVRYIRDIGQETVREHLSGWNAGLRERLLSLPGVEILAPEAEGAILLFRCAGIPSERIGAELNRRGICVRAGLHCAPLAHETLGTMPDGAVRISPGIFNRASDADRVYHAMREILKSEQAESVQSGFPS